MNNIYGPIHSDLVSVNFNLGRLCTRSGDFAAAIDFLQQTIVIGERANGLDDAGVAQAYLALGTLLFQIEPSKTALNYLRRALYIMELIGGRLNPELVQFYVNIASGTQELGQTKEALSYLRRALALAEANTGASQTTGLVLHSLALCLIASGDLKDALAMESRNYEILKAHLGEQNEGTVESNLLLKSITTAAVNQAKAAAITNATRKNQRLPTLKGRATVEQQPGSNAVKELAEVQLAELKKRARMIQQIPQNVKTERTRIAVAPGTSWRALPTSSNGNTATEHVVKKPQQSASPPTKKGKNVK